MKITILIILMAMVTGGIANMSYVKGFNQGVVQTEKCMDNWGKMKAYEDGFVCDY